MENQKKGNTHALRSRSPNGANTIQALFLMLLGLLEASFDMLSLLTAFLGGLRLNVKGATEPVTLNYSAENAAEESSLTEHQITRREAPIKAPVGIRVIAVLLGLMGLLEVFLGTIMLVKALLGGFFLPLQSIAVGGALGVFLLLVGLIKLFLTWGLWLLKRWAFWGTIGIVAISLLSGIIAITQPTPTAWTLMADMLFPLVVLIYFVVNRKARAAFQM